MSYLEKTARKLLPILEEVLNRMITEKKQRQKGRKGHGPTVSDSLNSDENLQN